MTKVLKTTEETDVIGTQKIPIMTLVELTMIEILKQNKCVVHAVAERIALSMEIGQDTDLFLEVQLLTYWLKTKSSAIRLSIFNKLATLVFQFLRSVKICLDNKKPNVLFKICKHSCKQESMSTMREEDFILIPLI